MVLLPAVGSLGTWSSWLLSIQGSTCGAHNDTTFKAAHETLRIYLVIQSRRQVIDVGKWCSLRC